MMGSSQNRSQILNGEVVIVVRVIEMECRMGVVEFCDEISARLDHWGDGCE
jgi:hypothetical protein